MRRQTRRLRNDAAVHIADLIALLAHPLRGLRQQLHRVCPRKTRIGVGKHAPDVAQSSGTEQGVDNGMRQGVGVRVSEQAAAVLDLHAAQHQLAPWDQGMNVPALTDAKAHWTTLHDWRCYSPWERPGGSRTAPEHGLGHGEIFRVSDLEIPRAALHQQRRMAEQFNRTGLIGHLVASLA